MKDRWKTNLDGWERHIRFGFLIPFFWGWWNMQHKVAPKLAHSRDHVIGQLAKALSETAHRPYDECFADIKCEWDYLDKNGIKSWDCK